MEHIFELSSTESKLNYIQSVAPSVFEKLQSKIQNGDIDDFRNRIIIDETVLKAFDMSGVDAVITTDIYDVPAIKKYLTKKSALHINGRYKVIDDLCFSNCDFLETLVFEEGVECIKERVLYNNLAIKKIVFPKSLNVIGYGAFQGCKNLDDVIFLNPQTWISPNSFENTKWFEQFEEDFVIVNGQLLKYNGNQEQLIIPEGTIHISHQVFYGNENIKSIVCPSTLEGIWTFTFSNCTNLQNVVFNNKLKMICISAFEGCTKLTEVSLPKGLEDLGAMAFDRRTDISFYDTDPKLTKHIKESYPFHTIII